MEKGTVLSLDRVREELNARTQARRRAGSAALRLAEKVRTVQAGGLGSAQLGSPPETFLPADFDDPTLPDAA